jgi:hypothetical protein
MKIEGFNDNQGRPIYQPLIVNQNGREILYLGDLTGSAPNPLTGQTEANGTSVIDVTDVHHSKFLFHIPGPPGNVGNAGAQMVRVCSGDVLPHGERGKWYLLRAYANVGADESQHPRLWPPRPTAGCRYRNSPESTRSDRHGRACPRLAPAMTILDWFRRDAR